MRSVQLIGLSVVLFICTLGAAEQADSVLAVVGSEQVSLREFKAYYTQVTAETGLADNMRSREKVLNEYLAHILLRQQAVKAGYTADNAGRKEYSRLLMQETLNRYAEEYIHNKITVSEEDIIRTYRWMNTKVLISHLFAPDKAGIDKLYRALQRGASFDSLAAEHFTDPVLKQKHGSLGYITYDELDPSLEKVAFSLPVLAVSTPVKTNYGYSIIRIDDRIEVPLLTAQDYVNKKNGLERIARKRRGEEVFKSVADSIRALLQIRFNEKTIHELLQAISAVKLSGADVFQEPLNTSMQRLMKRNVLTTVNGSKSVESVLSMAAYTSQKQRGFIRTAETLKDFLAGLEIRRYLLEKANALKLGNDTVVQGRLKEKYGMYLSARAAQAMRDTIQINSEEITHYYELNSSRYTVPAQVRLSTILTTNALTADSIKQMASAGRNFGLLAEQYSVQKAIAVRDGDIGYYTMQEAEQISKDLLHASVGDIVGPIQYEKQYAIVKVTDLAALRVRPLSEVREEIITELKKLHWQSIQSSLAVTRYKSEVTIYTEKLQAL